MGAWEIWKTLLLSEARSKLTASIPPASPFRRSAGTRAPSTHPPAAGTGTSPGRTPAPKAQHPCAEETQRSVCNVNAFSRFKGAGLTHASPFSARAVSDPPRLPPATHPNPTALHPGAWLLFFQPLSTDLMKDVISASPRSSQMNTGANSFPSRDAATRGLPNASLPRLWPMSAAEFPGAIQNKSSAGCRHQAAKPSPPSPPPQHTPTRAFLALCALQLPFCCPPQGLVHPASYLNGEGFGLGDSRRLCGL